eukprot:2559290-Amphidinium_carterae.1
MPNMFENFEYQSNIYSGGIPGCSTDWHDLRITARLCKFVLCALCFSLPPHVGSSGNHSGHH